MRSTLHVDRDKAGQWIPQEPDVTGNQHIPEELKAGTWLRQTGEMDLDLYDQNVGESGRPLRSTHWERLNLHSQPFTAHRMLSTHSGIHSGLWANMSRSSLRRHKSRPNEGLEAA